VSLTPATVQAATAAPTITTSATPRKTFVL
jgi:hypothetical protein